MSTHIKRTMTQTKWWQFWETVRNSRPDATHDKTKGTELKFQKPLLQLVKNKGISMGIYEAIRCVRPRLYGFPKTYKDNVPLKPILSMVGSIQHKLIK